MLHRVKPTPLACCFFFTTTTSWWILPASQVRAFSVSISFASGGRGHTLHPPLVVHHHHLSNPMKPCGANRGHFLLLHINATRRGKQVEQLKRKTKHEPIHSNLGESGRRRGSRARAAAVCDSSTLTSYFQCLNKERSRRQTRTEPALGWLA